MPYRVEIGYLPEGHFAVFPLYLFLPFSPHLGRKGRRLAIGWACLPSEAGLEPVFPRNPGSALFGSKRRAWEREDVQMHEGFLQDAKGKALGGGRLREARRDAEA